MSRRKPPATALGATPDELEARFYEALQRSDLDALMSVWADDDEIVCVHPGGPRVVGPAAIRASFEAIFANGAIPVVPEQVHRLEALSGVVHHLLEKIELRTDEGPRTAWVVATNVYLQTALGWRMVAHHASPGSLQAPQDPGSASTLH
jgi:ketosteroid isomerase-like protein